jgi:glycosyltransferase involved in cell wall biosynthesis
VILHYAAPPVIGGVERVLAEHARQFVQAGYQVTVVAGRGSQAALPEGVAARIIPEIDSEYRANLDLAEALAAGDGPPGFTALANRIEATLAPALAKSQVVIAHNVLTKEFNLPLTAALHRLLDGRPAWSLIAWVHDVSRFVRPSSGAPQRLGSAWDQLRRFRPDVAYVAVSEERRQHLAEAMNCPPDAVRVIPNGVDAQALLGLSDAGQDLVTAYDLLGADVALLMPVRVTRAKNIEYALQVTVRLLDLGLSPRLIVTGPPDPHSPDGLPYYHGLLALRDSLGLRGRAYFVYEGTACFGPPREIDAALVGELYRACDVVLLPSHREGFGIPVFEAGLAYRPVFTTTVPALELVEPGEVHVIEPDEPAGRLAERLAVLARQDPALRLRRRVRRGYTWPALFRTQIEPLLRARTAPAEESRP